MPLISQEENLKTWAEKRDSLLSEVSILEGEKQRLVKENRELAQSGLAIENRLSYLQGQIEEFEKKEKEFALLTSKESAALESHKTFLETEVSNLSKMVTVLSSQKDALSKDIELLVVVKDSAEARTILLNEVVERVSLISEKNATVVEGFFETIKKGSQEIVDINNKNVAATNLVLDKLPAMLLELQRHKLIRERI
jgi:hypothetical protein